MVTLFMPHMKKWLDYFGKWYNDLIPTVNDLPRLREWKHKDGKEWVLRYTGKAGHHEDFYFNKDEMKEE